MGGGGKEVSSLVSVNLTLCLSTSDKQHRARILSYIEEIVFVESIVGGPWIHHDEKEKFNQPFCNVTQRKCVFWTYQGS